VFGSEVESRWLWMPMPKNIPSNRAAQQIRGIQTYKRSLLRSCKSLSTAFRTAVKRMRQAIVCSFNLCDDAPRVRQIAECSREFFLGTGHGRASCLQTPHGVRDSRLQEMLRRVSPSKSAICLGSSPVSTSLGSLEIRRSSSHT